MGLREWWLGYKAQLTPSTWPALRGRHWLRVKEIPLDTWKRSAKARKWASSHLPELVSVAAIIVGLVLVAYGQAAAAATLIGACFLLSHNTAQRKADFRRRINETYGKAVTQLASDKIEERLGGIYTLESISKESPDDYWVVMETLCAFVRERSKRNQRDRTAISLEERIKTRAYFMWEEMNLSQDAMWQRAEQLEKLGEPPTTDIVAVLAVITRRNKESRERETLNAWNYELREAILKGADFKYAHLERAGFEKAHLDQADFTSAHLEQANFRYAHLEEANFSYAHLEQAHFSYARLERADFSGAHLKLASFFGARLEKAFFPGAYLERAVFQMADLEHAFFRNAHLEGANFSGAHLERAGLGYAYLEQANFETAHLEKAGFEDARLEGANFRFSRIEGTDLSRAIGLVAEQFDQARGDAFTRLPAELARPKHWPAPHVDTA